jgi:hypothetical protein
MMSSQGGVARVSSRPLGSMVAHERLIGARAAALDRTSAGGSPRSRGLHDGN